MTKQLNQTADALSALSVSKNKISDELFINLKDAILNGELPSGYVFPNESVLCKQLGVGRSTLREAFTALETLNMITRAKTGTCVNDSATIKNALNFNTLVEITSPRDVLEFRILLEVGVARIAAKKALKNDILNLQNIMDEMESHVNDPQKLTEDDYQFHSYLVEMTGNQLLNISFNAVRNRYASFVKEAFASGIYSTAVDDHKNIIDALKKNDAEAAAACMREHLLHIERYLPFDYD